MIASKPSIFNRVCPFSRNKKTILEMNISSNVNDFASEWASLDIDDIYFQVPYLAVMQQYGSDEILNYFVTLKNKEETIAVFMFQLTDFDFTKEIPQNPNDNFFKKYWKEKMKYKILVHGNLYQSGSHMNYFKDQTLSPNEKSEFILDVIEEMSQHLYEEKILVEALLIKDLDKGEKKSLLLQDDGKYSSFCIDPSMVLDINPSWNTIDDYLDNIKSKYKVRYRKARKERENLTLRQLKISDIDIYQDTMYQLYTMTAKESDFNIGFFKKPYFLELAKELQDKCSIYGYFDGDTMIGFYTGIVNNKIYSAHYLGFDIKYNNTHKLYLNILYDLVTLSIKNNASYLDFSRTALEIKSSVGAEPHDLHCYIKIDRHIQNKILPHLLKRYVPKFDWIQRKPFKIINQ